MHTNNMHDKTATGRAYCLSNWLPEKVTDEFEFKKIWAYDKPAIGSTAGAHPAEL